MRVVRPAVYILASKRNGTLYVGVTSDLSARVAIHRQDIVEGFTKRYGVHRLVYYEHSDTMIDAIVREKKLKKLSSSEKIALVEARNPNWRDLKTEIQEWRS